ncbi:MAG: hypothetical protein HS099_06670 [Ardenticatenaceae bacterium]|nr:hypothetical protein [Ardenticatenaceae bacterium]
MKRTRFTIHNSQFLIHNSWLWTAVLLLILLLLLFIGRWRSTATGAQVQVPMFYDAHYLFPRPWTQEQEAPGVPDPFPVAFYGDNTITQLFVSGANNLEMIEIWLQGSPYGWMDVTLFDETGPLYAGQVDFPETPRGRMVRFTFPAIPDAAGRTFWLVLAAPVASADRPAITHALGGDKLGGAIHLNEYPRPGNLELRTYVGGTAVPAALAEQLLPDLFRLRLQQYKTVKGEWFAVLFMVMVGLTAVYLVLARPSGQSLSQAVGWLAAGLLAGLLVWQVGDGRVRLPSWADVEMTDCVETRMDVDERGFLGCESPIISSDDLRVVNDMLPILWTARREPEERFIETAIVDGRPAIQVPGDSLIGYALDAPRNGRFQTDVLAEGQGVVRFAVMFNEVVLAEQEVVGGGRPYRFDLDLASIAGQGGELRLVTEAVDGAATGLWVQPQLLAQRDWLLAELPETAVPAGHQFAEDVTLVAYTVTPGDGETMLVTLYWRATRPLPENATVFVHLLDEQGNPVAQHDAAPVQNSYPLTIWPPGVLIADTHTLTAPAGSPAATQLAVGLYNPTTLARWPVLNPDGSVDPDGRALLPVSSGP